MSQTVAFFSSTTDMPPSFAGDSTAYAISIFGLMTVTVLAANWIWRMLWAMREDPHTLRHPLTIQRMIYVLVLLSTEMRVGPATMRMMLWSEVTPATRANLALISRLLEGMASIPFLAAWFLAWTCGPMLAWQLVRQPIPLNLWPSRDQIRAPLMIGFWTLAIAVAVAFIR